MPWNLYWPFALKVFDGLFFGGPSNSVQRCPTAGCCPQEPPISANGGSSPSSVPWHHPKKQQGEKQLGAPKLVSHELPANSCVYIHVKACSIAFCPGIFLNWGWIQLVLWVYPFPVTMDANPNNKVEPVTGIFNGTG